MRVDWRALRWMGLAGALGGLGGALLGEPLSGMMDFPGGLILKIGCTHAALIAVTACSLFIASARLMGRGGIQGLWPVMFGGLLAGAVSGAIAQATYGSVSPSFNDWSRELFRILVWAFGFCIAGAVFGRSFPILGARRGAVGGALAGVLGSVAFVGIGFVLHSNDTLARIAGYSLTGMVLGLSTVIAETAGRRAWLRVSWGPGEERLIPLGPVPILVGSDSKLVQVYVHGVAPVARIYTVQSGSIMWSESPQGHKSELRPGSPQVIGTVRIEAVLSANTAPSAVAKGTPSVTASAPIAAQARAARVVAKPLQVVTPAKGWFLVVGSRRISLVPGMRMTQGEVSQNGVQAGEIIAEVVQRPAAPGLLGLRNLMSDDWTALRPGHPPAKVSAGKTVPLTDGMRLMIGAAQARVEQVT